MQMQNVARFKAKRTKIPFAKMSERNVVCVENKSFCGYSRFFSLATIEMYEKANFLAIQHSVTMIWNKMFECYHFVRSCMIQM